MPVTAEKIVNDATDNLTAPAANVAAEKVKDGASQKSNEKRAPDSKKAKYPGNINPYPMPLQVDPSWKIHKPSVKKQRKK